MPPAPASTETDAVPERATLGGDTQSRLEQVVLGILIVVPFLAVAAAVPVAWGGWLGWSDAVIFLVAYAITGHGITVGFHRLFTHKSFKPNRAVKVALAVAGSMAIQGPVVRWVADHRKHHKFSARDGDPHSPWRYGTTVRALTKACPDNDNSIRVPCGGGIKRYSVGILVLMIGVTTPFTWYLWHRRQS